MPETETIFIAVSDGVLADSLRFSLELEGFTTRFCDEHSLHPAMAAAIPQRGCLVLDQDVFTRMAGRDAEGAFSRGDMPVVLMVSHATSQVMARAAAAGVTSVVEKPLLGGVLFAAVREALGKAGAPERRLRP
ncbi:MAG: hypothetical protein ACRECX_11505 [Methyloceanibacter sp.]|uniref:hypothetical protein n=1 Tax=Methyloceanibacter sp. TaxID=1965321 RepID=UPI003D6D4789